MTKQELDERYIKRDEFDGEVKRVGDKHYTTKSEHEEIMAEFSAMKSLQQTNNKVLDQILLTTHEVKENQMKDSASKDAEITQINKSIEKVNLRVQTMSKGYLKSQWDFLPNTLRFMLTFALVFVCGYGVTILLTTMLTRDMGNHFMKDNGNYVAIFNLIISLGVTVYERMKGGGNIGKT